MINSDTKELMALFVIQPVALDLVMKRITIERKGFKVSLQLYGTIHIYIGFNIIKKAK